MSISNEEVRHLAALARLRLTVDEEQKMATDMDQILAFVRQIEQLDTSDVQPMTHVLDLYNVMREDTVAPRISKEEGLRDAPGAGDSYFHVPKVIE